MNLREAVAVAKQQVADLFAPDVPGNVRLEEFLYVGSSRVDLQACKLEYSIVSPK